MINYYLKNYKNISLLIASFIFLNMTFADPTDGCDLGENQFFLMQDGSVLYNSSEDIAGFQFNVSGLDLTGASGGAAGDAGFTVSTGSVTVIGFSFTGAAQQRLAGQTRKKPYAIITI